MYSDSDDELFHEGVCRGCCTQKGSLGRASLGISWLDTELCPFGPSDYRDFGSAGPAYALV